MESNREKSNIAIAFAILLTSFESENSWAKLAPFVK